VVTGTKHGEAPLRIDFIGIRGSLNQLCDSEQRFDFSKKKKKKKKRTEHKPNGFISGVLALGCADGL
jgi:hypothetical protein